MLLCKGKNEALAEYALAGITNPLSVADYELTKAVPEALKSQFPSIDDLEQELREEGEGFAKHMGEEPLQQLPLW